jgi:cytochrome c556
MTSEPFDANEFGAKLETLLDDHRRFIAQFEQSLKNAGHFIALADRSMEQEPEDTVAMLNQIREIDLLGYLQRLAEEFDTVRASLATSPFWKDAASFATDLDDLATRYEALQEEAASQLNGIDAILNPEAS